MFQVHFPNKSFEAAATLIEAYIIEQQQQLSSVNRGPVEPYNCMGILATAAANRTLKTGSAPYKDMMTLKTSEPDFLGLKPVLASKRTPVTFGSNGMTSRRLFPLPHWPRAPPSPSSPPA